MREPRTSWRRTPIVIAAVMTLLSMAEAAQSHGSGLGGSPEAPWTAHIQRVDEVLAVNNIAAAVREWHDAYVAGLGSRRWEGLVEVGDAYLRIGEAAGFRKAYEPKARRLYLAAFFRARQQGSLNGVLRTAEAFAALGDREVVEQCFRVAEGLATQARDAQAQARVQAFREQLTARVLGAKSPDVDPF